MIVLPRKNTQTMEVAYKALIEADCLLRIWDILSKQSIKSNILNGDRLQKTGFYAISTGKSTQQRHQLIGMQHQCNGHCSSTVLEVIQPWSSQTQEVVNQLSMMIKLKHQNFGDKAM